MDYQALLGRQKSFFRTGNTLSVSFRRQALKRLYQLVDSNKKRIQHALFRDLGKGSSESFVTEVAPLLNEISLARHCLKNWERPRKVGTSIINRPGKSTVERIPHGVCLIAAPWNFPLNLTLVPLASALAGGNCAIVKPSEQAPYTADILQELISRYFEPELAAVVQGGPDVLLSLVQAGPDFLFFTGGKTAGSALMKEAAGHLTALVLELGGKNPCIVDESADIKVAARRIVWGKFINAGQSCVAPDYVLVQRSARDKLIEYCIHYIEKFYGADPFVSGEYGRIVNDFHFRRLKHLMGDVRIIYGGEWDRGQRYISPTIVEAEWGSAIMHEEVFGPVLPVIIYDSLAQTLEVIASKAQPLGVYLFSVNRKNIAEVKRVTRSGMLCINGTLHVVISRCLPFGGVGESGMGRYHGRSGYEAFTRERSILVKNSHVDWRIYPPYRMHLHIIGSLVRRFI